MKVIYSYNVYKASSGFFVVVEEPFVANPVRPLGAFPWIREGHSEEHIGDERPG